MFNFREIRSINSFVFYYLTGLLTLTFLGLVLRLLFYQYNLVSFSNLSSQDFYHSLLNGLIFDAAIAALMMLFLIIPYWVMARSSLHTTYFKTLLYLASIILIIGQTSDTLYFVDAGRHVSYEIKDIFNDAGSLFLTAVFQHGTFIIGSFIIGILISMLFVTLLPKLFSPIFNKQWLPKAIALEVNFILLLFLSLILIRGGISGVPLEPLTAFKSGSTAQGQITLNGAYNISHRLLAYDSSVKLVNIPLPKDLSSHQLHNKDIKALSDVNGGHNKVNVVMVFLESWQAEQMKSYGSKDDVTPYFDYLRTQSLSPNIVFAGGGRTTEGLFSTLCSFQNPLGQTVAQSQLQSFDYSCLPHLLKSKGWNTAFFQGSNKNTSGTGIFAQRLGFTDSYGKSDIKTTQFKHNKWGVHDPDLYQFVLSQSKTIKEPFFLGVNTTSTHDDELPDAIKPSFGMDSSLDRYKSVLNFADQSLQQFIEHYLKLKFKLPTIFVLISDHTAGRVKNQLSKSLIPGIIYSPELGIIKTINRPVHQRDFAPTLLNILNIQSPSSFAGTSMLAPYSKLWDAEFYNTGQLSMVKDNTLVNYNLLTHKESCFSINYHQLESHAITCSVIDTELMKSALGFTHLSQKLLFEGKTKQFNVSP